MPVIELISIGDELLSGRTLNTNAAYLSKRLEKAGYAVSLHQTIPDEEEVIQKILKAALNRSDLILCTGGLGPTVDDRTRKGASQVFGDELIFHSEVAEELKKRYGKDFATLENQATLPKRAKILCNGLGTAPGSLFEDGKKSLILMPGVPSEMKMMFEEEVLPYIQKKFPSEGRLHVEELHLFGLCESDVAGLLGELAEKNPEIQFAIYPHIGTLTIHLKIESKQIKKIKEPLSILKERFQKSVFDAPSGTLQEAVHHLLIERKQTLSCAESCTGGLLASIFTKMAGVSEYFLGSIVSYANEVKISALGVSEKTLEKHGAVSAKTAKEMVLGAQKLTQSDYALSVTGVAGPLGGTEEKPVGTVWCGIAFPDKKPEIFLLNLRGDREIIQIKSVQALIARLYLEIR